MNARSRKMKSHQRANRRGAVTVEMAMCVPLLIVLLLAAYEIARVNMVIHATESAAYEATRTAIVPGAKRATVEASARQVLNSVGVRDFSLTVTPDLSSADSETVKVDIRVPFRNNSAVFRLFVSDPVFRGSCELSRETF